MQTWVENGFPQVPVIPVDTTKLKLSAPLDSWKDVD